MSINSTSHKHKLTCNCLHDAAIFLYKTVRFMLAITKNFKHMMNNSQIVAIIQLSYW